MEIHKLDESEQELAAEHSSSGLKITAIKPAVKNENRVNIFVNEEYAFSLDLAQVIDYKIKVGKNLSPEELDELKHASEFGKLYQRTLEWVLTRPHSEKETRDYLRHKRQKRETENRQAIRNRERSKEEREKYKLKTKELPLFSDDDIEKIITRLIEKGYLNDYEFAKYFLENRNAKKGTSMKKLQLELIKKGISQAIVDELLNENLRTDEEEIQKIIAKKRSRYDNEKLIQYLARQGFGYDLIRSALERQES